MKKQKYYSTIIVLITLIATSVFAESDSKLPPWQRTQKSKQEIKTNTSRPQKSCIKVFAYSSSRGNMIAYAALNDSEIKDLMVTKNLVTHLNGQEIIMERLSFGDGFGKDLILVKTPDGAEAITTRGYSIDTGCK